MNYRRRLVLAMVVGVSALFCAGQVSAAEAPKPASTLKQLDGKASTIADYAGKGKWLVVMLWASDCMVCNREAPNYEAFYDKHKNKDAVMLGVSLDGHSKIGDAKDFIKRHAIKFPNLIDEPENIARMYQNLTGDDWVGTPTFMVYNPKGELLGAQVGAIPVSMIEDFIKRESASSSAM